MQHRQLGKTGFEVSAIGFGAWAIGADWGPVYDEESLRALHAVSPRAPGYQRFRELYPALRSHFRRNVIASQL